MVRWMCFEFAKIKSYKTFWLALGVWALVLMGAVSLLSVELPGVTAASQFLSHLWISGYIAQIFLGYLVILLVCNEFETRTLRQHIITGLGRIEFLCSRLIFFGLVILVMSAFVLLLSLFSRAGLEVAGGETATTLQALLVGFLKLCLRSLAYVSMALLIAVIFRRASTALAVYVSWSIVFEPLLGSLLKKNDMPFYQWLPTEVFSHLLSSPFAALLAPNGDTAPGMDGPAIAIYAATFGYIAIFWLASGVRLQFLDL